ncbi:hypothetical protein MAR_027068 [Mya arenaria]|uniref:Uncharacterized protein n=1 Tax=Mya arenaria TaxID=6604 RepID=A0ABY7ESE0_MYAAR|nr:hypothetical protein MAR_027068 [Mya arenaria]
MMKPIQPTGDAGEDEAEAVGALQGGVAYVEDRHLIVNQTSLIKDLSHIRKITNLTKGVVRMAKDGHALGMFEEQAVDKTNQGLGKTA